MVKYVIDKWTTKIQNNFLIVKTALGYSGSQEWNDSNIGIEDAVEKNSNNIWVVNHLQLLLNPRLNNFYKNCLNANF